MWESTKRILLKDKHIREEVAMWPLPPIPGPKPFTPKHNLPNLDEYGMEVFPASYWAHWVKRDWAQCIPGRSWVKSDALTYLAKKAGVEDAKWLDRVCMSLVE